MTDKKKNKSISTKKPLIFGIFFVLVALAVVVIIVLANVINSNLSHSDVNNFQLANRFDITIQKDEVKYDENTNSNNFFVYLKVKNIKEYTTYDGYDKDKPTADQISPEQESNLTQEQIDEINKNTIYKYATDMQNKVIPSNTLSIHAQQGGDELESVNTERRDGTSSNSESMSQKIDLGQTKDISLVYKLKSDEKCTLMFMATIDKADADKDEFKNKIYDQKEVEFSFDGLNVTNVREVNNSQVSKSNDEFVNFNGIGISLSSGWIVDKNGSSAIVLKNSKIDNSRLEISYSSSENAEKLAKSTAAWSNPPAQVSTKNIGNKSFYYYEQGKDMFVLCVDGKDNFSYRIACSNLSLDDVSGLISNIAF